MLVPTLEPGDVVMMDNLVAHKPVAVRRAIDGRRTALPVADSSGFNPMEMAFLKFKAFLKQVAARTFDDLRNAIGRGVNIFALGECRNYFTATGYEPA